MALKIICVIVFIAWYTEKYGICCVGTTVSGRGEVWRARDIGLRNQACKWMDQGFMSVDTKLGASKAFLKSLYNQYADWGVDFGKMLFTLYYF